MERSRDQNKPFLAFYSMALCHDVTNDLKAPVPYGPRGRYDNYAEMVAQMDLQVGRLMKFLKSSGLDDNTLVFFTTDNGTAAKSKLSAKGERNDFVVERVVSQFHGQSVPGGKGRLTDWGTRVPTIATWKGVIEPGQLWDDLVDLSDVLPTVAELTGGTLPGDPQLDGHSFAALLRGKGLSTRKWVYAEHKGRFFAKTHGKKLYNTGDFFNTEADPSEESPLDTSTLSTEATSEWNLLRRALENLR